MSLARLTKSPADVLDYIFDYSTWLGTDTIDTSAWKVPSGITVNSNTKTSNTTTVWIAGGQIGQDYKVENTITTIGGRTKVQTFDLSVVNP
jgi:hypothetical protein